MLMLPGRTEYVEKYLHVAAAMGAGGLATVIVDWRGQGLADRLLPDRAAGHVGAFRDYQRDLAAVVGLMRDLGLPEPWFLMAHSMGGCIGLRALHEGLPVKAAVFSGPMFGIRIDGWLRPAAWAMGLAARAAGLGAGFAPTTGPAPYVLAAPFEGNLLTTDPDMYALMRRQLLDHPELALGGPTRHWLIEALIECRALRALPSPALPAYAAYGAEERIADAADMVDRMARWPGGRIEAFPGARHEVLMETEERRARFFAAALELYAGAAGR
ncbi:MAG: alpha/beta hydrolase [Rhodobacteraceae bacterium]|nr:alpha/beta hydrolase [Paracoccaceae bacterium]